MNDIKIWAVFVQDQSSKHFSPLVFSLWTFEDNVRDEEGESLPPCSCPPPPPTFRRPEERGESDKERGRQESTCAHSTHRCLGLAYYYLSFPLSFDLSMSATLQNINFAFLIFSTGGFCRRYLRRHLYAQFLWALQLDKKYRLVVSHIQLK